MFFPFKKILEKRARQYRFWPEILGLQVCQLWQKEAKKILGPGISSGCQAQKFQTGILVVLVKNSALAQELRFREREIQQKINKTLKTTALKRIVYKVSNFKSATYSID